MKKLLVTGGLGYIGGRVSQALSEKHDYSLRLTTRRSDLSGLPWAKKAEIFPLDLTSISDCVSVCRGINCVIHFAAMNEIDSATDPEKALIVNGIGTLKLLKAAEEAGVERFIYFSTAHVYGAPLVGEISENTLPRPVHPYAITHRTAEDFVLASNERKNLTGIAVRMSNAIGAPIDDKVNRWSLVINDLCRQAVVKKELELKTSGHQKRDFIAISDAINAVFHFLNMNRDNTGNGLFNLGGEASLSILYMAELIAERCEKIIGFRPSIKKPVHTAGSDSDGNLNFCINKLKSTGFKLTGNLADEIDETLLFCSKYFKYSNE